MKHAIIILFLYPAIFVTEHNHAGETPYVAGSALEAVVSFDEPVDPGVIRKTLIHRLQESQCCEEFRVTWSEENSSFLIKAKKVISREDFVQMISTPARLVYRYGAAWVNVFDFLKPDFPQRDLIIWERSWNPQDPVVGFVKNDRRRELDSLLQEENFRKKLGNYRLALTKYPFKENPLYSEVVAYYGTNSPDSTLVLNPKDAYKVEHSTRDSLPVLQVKFSRQNRDIFYSMTQYQSQDQKFILVLLDNQVIAKPYVNDPITHGVTSIPVGLREEELKRLIIMLESGPLPSSTRLDSLLSK